MTVLGRGKSIYSPEFRKQVEALWNEGVPTAEMGRRLGITKNAVIGIVHRMGLEPCSAPALPRRPALPGLL
jgi:GcrA cell cycle regulator